MICKICQKPFDNLSLHIRTHNILKKEYFDKCLKRVPDGVCIVCGKPTSFKTIEKGYNRFCSVNAPLP